LISCTFSVTIKPLLFRSDEVSDELNLRLYYFNYKFIKSYIFTKYTIPYIEEEQTTLWPKGKVQKDKQRSTKHIYKTKDRVLNNGGELRCSGRVGSFCSTSDTRRVNLVANPVISHGRGKDGEVNAIKLMASLMQ
jgi:hypothetical protein